MAGRGGHQTIGTGVKGDPNAFTGGTIDQQSHGVLYIGFGPIRIGRDTEGIRHTFQNRLAHDRFWTQNYGEAYPWVLKTNRANKWYWYFGSGSGNTNW